MDPRLEVGEGGLSISPAAGKSVSKDNKKRSVVLGPTYGKALQLDGRGSAGRWVLVLLPKLMPHCELGNKHLTFQGPAFLPLMNAGEKDKKGKGGINDILLSDTVFP